MFGFREVLVDRPVEDQLSNLDQRDKFLRPHLRRVKDVEVELVLVSLRNDLNGKRPLGRRAIQNSFVKVFTMEVWKRR